jgi:spermidine synthase
MLTRSNSTTRPSIPNYGLLTSEERGVRYLHFDSAWVQGAMRLSNPTKLELEYTRWLMAGLLVKPSVDDVNRVLLIGLGAGSVAKFCLTHLPQARIDVVEIDPRIPRYAEQWFELPKTNPQLHISIDDGVAYVSLLASKRASHQRYDLIVVDGFDDNASAGGLDSVAFYEDCKTILKPDGALTTNLFSRGKRHVNGVSRISKVFDCVRSAPQCDSGNVVVMATSDVDNLPSKSMSRERAQRLRATTGLSLIPIAQSMAG